MLVCDKGTRKTCAECLGSPYLNKSKLHHSVTNPLSKSGDGQDDDNTMPEAADHSTMVRKPRSRPEDHSSKAMHQGNLWKLNQGKDPSDNAMWLQRDMWVANNGSLCYFSIADSKRLVLLDSHRLHEAEITMLPKEANSAKEFAFEIKCSALETDQEETYTFAAQSEEDVADWMRHLKNSATMDAMPTV